MNITGVTLRIRKVGGPSGNMLSYLYATSGLNPTGSALATSADVLINSIPNTAAAGNLMGFTFSSALEAAASTAIAVVLRPKTDATIDGANNFRWVTSNSTGPDGCTDFPVYRGTTDGGTNWMAANNLGYRRSFFTATVATHDSSGTVSWITDGLGATWDMTTFDFDENPSTLTAGTITYDIGTGSSAVTPTYSQTNLTEAQVQALGDLTGQYLYVKVNLSVSTPFYDRAVIGDGSVDTK